MGINSDWEKWVKTGKAPWEYEAFKERMEAKQLRKAMTSGYGKASPRQGYFDWNAKTVNDNIRKAIPRPTMFNKPVGLGGQAAGYLKTVAPKVAPKALGFFANPWLATLAGIFGASGMDQDRSAEYMGSPQHQQWLARKGPLSKDWQ